MTYTQEDGWNDCINGVPYQEGKGEDYDMGYEKAIIEVLLLSEGMRDCIKGIPHREGIGEAYDMGYRVQFQLEQIQSAQTIDPPNVSDWLKGEQLAEEGKPLPLDAPSDCRRGYDFRNDINDLRGRQ